MRFYPPKTTTINRENVVLEKGEIVFDTDINRMFIGDGITEGGIDLNSDSMFNRYNRQSVYANMVASITL